MQAADVCLAGPFGDTFQAQYVITGKAYQYLAMGRPTIVGQNKESGVFRDKHDVLIVPQGDAKSLAETIRWAMNNGDALRRIGLNGQKLFSEKFSNQRLAERLESGLVGLGLLEASTSPEQKQHDK